LNFFVESRRVVVNINLQTESWVKYPVTHRNNEDVCKLLGYSLQLKGFEMKWKKWLNCQIHWQVDADTQYVARTAGSLVLQLEKS
jgi:hypothetical protein